MYYRHNFPRLENEATDTFAIIKADAYALSAVPSKRALWHVFTTNSLTIIVRTYHYRLNHGPTFHSFNSFVSLFVWKGTTARATYVSRRAHCFPFINARDDTHRARFVCTANHRDSSHFKLSFVFSRVSTKLPCETSGKYAHTNRYALTNVRLIRTSLLNCYKGNGNFVFN